MRKLGLVISFVACLLISNPSYAASCDTKDLCDGRNLDIGKACISERPLDIGCHTALKNGSTLTNKCTLTTLGRTVEFFQYSCSVAHAGGETKLVGGITLQFETADRGNKIPDIEDDSRIRLLKSKRVIESISQTIKVLRDLQIMRRESPRLYDNEIWFLGPNEKQPFHAFPLYSKMPKNSAILTVGTERGFAGAALSKAKDLFLVDRAKGIFVFNVINTLH